MILPSGGDKDVSAPNLISVEIIDKVGKINEKTISFEFDEYIQLNKWSEYFYISPPLNDKAAKKIKGRSLYLSINEELADKTTYHVSLNLCIKDNHEGNILDTLDYMFSTNKHFDTLNIAGNLRDSYTLDPVKNAWIMLFSKETDDTLIFKNAPSFVSKTNKDGFFYFPNLKSEKYKIVSLTGFDWVYDNNEKISFKVENISAKTDSFVSLFSFDPIISTDSIYSSNLILQSDSSLKNTKDSIIKKDTPVTGRLQVITEKNSAAIFQLIQNGNVVNETYFKEKPYLINNILPGKYNLKYIDDRNRDSLWSTGNWEYKIQPENVANYPSEITIRQNWDLDLEWFIE